ncbi:MAG TPA: DedA family protein [Phycisphaerae bacterium]|nr:DedA family protein [Phycisphaerae bacterium]
MQLASVLSLAAPAQIQESMQAAFYPVLFGLLALASLGIPIPEDVPLIAAGVLLHTHPGIASWPGTLLVALVGIMTGDLVLYRLGRRWGPGVVSHRSVSWLLTPALFRKATQRFNRWGTWFCFFGRFFVGVRAAMCLTAGATGFPYWRFFLADFAGALLSVPLFIGLGYWFAEIVPKLRTYTEVVQVLITVGLVGVLGALFLLRRRRRRKRVAELQSARAAGKRNHAAFSGRSGPGGANAAPCGGE